MTACEPVSLRSIAALLRAIAIAISLVLMVAVKLSVLKMVAMPNSISVLLVDGADVQVERARHNTLEMASSSDWRST